MIYPFQRIICPFFLNYQTNASHSHPNTQPRRYPVFHLSPNRFDWIEIRRAGWPGQLPETKLLSCGIVIMVDMSRSMILHYHNARPGCPSSNCEWVLEKGGLNAFTVNEPINSPFPTLSPLLQHRNRSRTNPSLRCEIEYLYLCLFLLPFSPELYYRCSLLVLRLISGRVEMIGKLRSCISMQISIMYF